MLRRAGSHLEPESDREPATSTIRSDAVASARAARLRHVSDERPGLRRVRCGTGFRYLTPEGRPVRDPQTLARIRTLAIPPAWTRVWICPLPNGHLQATGRDERGRKQYRYHARWRAVRDEAKYDRLVDFAQALPALRRHVSEDLARSGLSREKVLATVVRLLETTLIRIGNEEYARENGSFGLTTLRNRHVKVEGTRVSFAFRGKSGVRHRLDVRDRRLARIVRRCQELPGQELFKYVAEDGTTRAVASEDVNDYLREATGKEFSAKDFRTWAGTVLAARTLQQCPAGASPAEAKRQVVAAIATVAERLRNTPTVCRQCYIHPGVIEGYLAGALKVMVPATAPAALEDPNALTPEENAVLAFLLEQARPTSRS